jgi:DNA modification methylase
VNAIVRYVPRTNELYNWDALQLAQHIPSNTVNCVVTSPPYFGLRDYGVEGQIGLERTPDEYVQSLVTLFREVRKGLRDDGTLWLNLGDSYANDDKWGGSSGGKHVKALHGNTGVGRGRKSTGLKPKDLIGIPWRVAFALQADGWYLRSDIVWSKPNPMPESVTDRPTKAHEYVFLLSKSPRYHYDADAIREVAEDRPFDPVLKSKKRHGTAWMNNAYASGASGYGHHPNGRNKRSVWTVTTKPFEGSHFATFPEDLIEPMILAGCPTGGIVYDPFMGSGTTGIVAQRLGRNWMGSELNPEYAEMARYRIAGRWHEYLAKTRGQSHSTYMFTEQPA